MELEESEIVEIRVRKERNSVNLFICAKIEEEKIVFLQPMVSVFCHRNLKSGRYDLLYLELVYNSKLYRSDSRNYIYGAGCLIKILTCATTLHRSVFL